RSYAEHDSIGAASGSHRLSVLWLAAHGGGHRPVELPAGDLVLHHLCWSRVELAGRGAKTISFLLLWHAAAAWPIPGKYAIGAGCCCGSAGISVGAIHAQGYWTIEPGSE